MPDSKIIGTMKRKNICVEVLRFVFAIFVSLFHYVNRNPMGGWFDHGAIGVDFFFLLSGFFVARNACAQETGMEGDKTYDYVVKRIKSFIVPFLLMWATSFVLGNFFTGGEKNYIVNFLKGTPALLQLHSTGIKMTHYLSQTWYLSAMIITILGIYPLIIRLKNSYLFCIAPVVSFLILGYISGIHGNLIHNVDPFFGIVTKGLLRAFAVMNLGAFTFGVFDKNKMLKLGKAGKAAAMLFVSGLLFIVIIYASIPTGGNDLDFVCCYYLAIAIGGLFLLSNNNMLNTDNKVFQYLGKLSLYIYLSHRVILDYVMAGIRGRGGTVQYVSIFIILSVLLGVLLERITNCLAHINGRNYCCSRTE